MHVRAAANGPASSARDWLGQSWCIHEAVCFAQDAYLEICRCYKAIAAMPSVAADAERAATVLRKICWFVVLATTSSDQARMAFNSQSYYLMKSRA